MKNQLLTKASLVKRYESVLAHAEFDDEVVEVVLLCELEQVLPRLLPQTQVDRVCVEPPLHYISLLLRLDVARQDRAEEGGFPIRKLESKLLPFSRLKVENVIFIRMVLYLID